MKKITYQITFDDNDYLECINQIEKLILFPANGNMVFKIEEIREEEKPRPVIVNDVKYSSYEDYLKLRGKGKRNETTQ